MAIGLFVCVYAHLLACVGRDKQAGEGSTLEGLNEHWNAGSAVSGSYDKMQEGGWLL